MPRLLRWVLLSFVMLWAVPAAAQPPTADPAALADGELSPEDIAEYAGMLREWVSDHQERTKDDLVRKIAQTQDDRLELI